MAEPNAYLRCFPGSSRQNGHTYLQVPNAGDLWYEAFEQALPGAVATPGNPNLYVLPQTAGLGGSAIGPVTLVGIVVSASSGTFDFSDPANSGRLAGF